MSDPDEADDDHGYQLTAEGPRKMDREQFTAFLQEGVDSLDRGEGVPHDELTRRIRARLGKLAAA